MPADDLRLARESALEVGEIIARGFSAGDAVHYKERDQPVTATDLAVDRRLRERLAAARPDYGWLSEETADSAARLEKGRVWVVDPIDGTTSFVEARPELAVCIGLVDRGTPVVGVVYNPLTDELYVAERGAGAFLNGRRIRVAAPPPGEPTLLVSGAELRRGALEPFRGPWRLSVLGSTAYKMVKVADGTGQAYVSPGQKREWDVCAAALVASEAGCRVRQCDGSELRFNRSDTRVHGIVAVGALAPALADELFRRCVHSTRQERQETHG